MAKITKETTLSKLAASLTAQGVTAITVVDSGVEPDPNWFVVDHPAGVKLHVVFGTAATPEQTEAAQTAILAASLVVVKRNRSVAGMAKEIAKLPPENRDKLRTLLDAYLVRNIMNRTIMKNWGFDFDFDEITVL